MRAQPPSTCPGRLQHATAVRQLVNRSRFAGVIHHLPCWALMAQVDASGTALEVSVYRNSSVSLTNVQLRCDVLDTSQVLSVDAGEGSNSMAAALEAVSEAQLNSQVSLRGLAMHQAVAEPAKVRRPGRSPALCSMWILCLQGHGISQPCWNAASQRIICLHPCMDRATLATGTCFTVALSAWHGHGTCPHDGTR